VQIQETFGGKGLTVVGVTEETVEDSRTFAAQHQVNYPILAGSDGPRKAFGIDVIWGSIFYLVSPDGRIVAKGLDESCEILKARLT
jgi:peroxiredoxin